MEARSGGFPAPLGGRRSLVPVALIAASRRSSIRSPGTAQPHRPTAQRELGRVATALSRYGVNLNAVAGPIADDPKKAKRILD